MKKTKIFENASDGERLLDEAIQLKKIFNSILQKSQ